MGQHKINPVALAAAARPAISPGDEMFGYQVQGVIELRPERAAEVAEAANACRDQEEARLAVHRVASQWNLKDTPDEFDFVVYDVVTVGRPNPFLPNPNQVPTAALRMEERKRWNLGDLRRRADQAFAEHGTPTPGIAVQH